MFGQTKRGRLEILKFAGDKKWENWQKQVRPRKGYLLLPPQSPERPWLPCMYNRALLPVCLQLCAYARTVSCRNRHMRVGPCLSHRQSFVRWHGAWNTAKKMFLSVIWHTPQWWCLWEYEGPRESNAFWRTLKIPCTSPLGFLRPLALLHVQKFYVLLKVSLWHEWAYKLLSERQQHTWLNPHAAPWRKVLFGSSFWLLPLPP